jgi:iron complex outermembrane receptor protein
MGAFNETYLRRVLKRTLFLTLLTLSLAGYASSQTTSAVLKGVVTDEAKAIIPGATLTLKSDGGDTRETISNDNGEFSFGEMPFGKYQLTVTKEGFSDVSLTVILDGATQTANLTLDAGAVTESVTVVMDSAEAAVESTLKLPVSIHETPRSVSVLGEERLREQNFRQVSDVINYVPGVTQNSYRNGSYHFYARGYRQSPDDTRLDGFSGINVGNNGFGASMFGIEEAVVLRGPASLIYGQTGSPGGFINLISKKPREEYFTRVDLRAGGYSGNGVSLDERPQYGIDVDSTGKIFGNDRLLYRGLVTVENMNYFTKDTLDRNRYANGSLAIKLDKVGRHVITPSVQWTRYFRPYGGGIIASPTTSLRTDDGLRTISQDDLSPLDVNLYGGRRIEETAWGGIEYRGVVMEKLRVNAAYRYVSFDTDIDQFAPQVTSGVQIAALQTENVVSRIQSKSLTERAYNNFNADAIYEWKNAGWWKNTTQLGFYGRVLDSRTTSPQGSLPSAQSPINIYSGIASSSLQDTYPPIAFGPRTRDVVWNGFVQNRTSLDNGRWNLTVGFNYSQNDPAAGAVRKSDLVPNASVVFNATPELALYASYATSFNPVDPELENEQGNRGVFDPTIGKSYEIGAKYDLLNRRASVAFAVFQNQIENALVQSDVGFLNPRGNRFYVPAGTRRARGAEVSGDFQIRQDLRISAGISYLDAIYKGFPTDLTASGLPPLTSPLPNSRAEKSPRWSYNAYTRYDRREGYLKGFGAGLGIIYQGERIGSNGAQTFAAPDPLLLPSFVRLDTAVFYRLSKFVNFALNVENLLDEVIFVNASVGSNIEVAAPRAMTVRTTFNF